MPDDDQVVPQLPSPPRPQPNPSDDQVVPQVERGQYQAQIQQVSWTARIASEAAAMGGGKQRG